MKILLVNVKNTDNRVNDFPLGLAYLSATLKDFFECIIYDLNFSDEKEFFEFMLDNEVGLVGISSCTQYFHASTQLAKKIKIYSPKTYVVFGGYQATSEYEYIIKHYIEFDFILMGKGEKSLNQLAQCIEKKDFTGLKDISHIAYRDENLQPVIQNDFRQQFKRCFEVVPDRTRIHKYPYRKNEINETIACISTMRGCYFNCSFCSISVNDKVYLHKYEMIEEDIKNLCLNEEINCLYFNDPDFIVNVVHCKTILEIIKKYSQIKHFKISTRSDTVLKHKDIIEQLLQYGCNSIEIGFESFSDTQLIRYNKGVTANENIECIHLLMSLKKRYDFWVVPELIPFDPFVKISEITDTVNVLLNCGFKYEHLEPWLFISIVLYPNTEIRNLAILNKLALDVSGELPYWKFQSEKTSVLFSIWMFYKQCLWPDLLELRKGMRLKMQKTIEISQIQKIKNLEMYKKIDEFTFVFLRGLLKSEGDTKESKALLDEAFRKVKKYKEYNYN